MGDYDGQIAFDDEVKAFTNPNRFEMAKDINGEEATMTNICLFSSVKQREPFAGVHKALISELVTFGVPKSRIAAPVRQFTIDDYKRWRSRAADRNDSSCSKAFDYIINVGRQSSFAQAQAQAQDSQRCILSYIER